MKHLHCLPFCCALAWRLIYKKKSKLLNYLGKANANRKIFLNDLVGRSFWKACVLAWEWWTLKVLPWFQVIIIIMSRHLRGYPWPSLATSPYHSSPPAGLQGYIPCPHTAAVCRFVLVVPLLHIHVWGSNRSTSLMSLSLLLQQCPACLVRRTCIVFVMGGKCPYSWSLVGCCRQDLFNTALNMSCIISVQPPFQPLRKRPCGASI